MFRFDEVNNIHSVSFNPEHITSAIWAKALITFSFCLKEYQKMKTGLEGDRAYLPKLFTVKFVYFRLKICSHLCTDQTDPRIDAVQPNKLKISIP